MTKRKKLALAASALFFLTGLCFAQHIAIDNVLVQNDLPLFSEVSMILYLVDRPKEIRQESSSTMRNNTENSVRKYSYKMLAGKLVSHEVKLDEGSSFSYEYSYDKSGRLVQIKEKDSDMELSYEENGDLKEKTWYYHKKKMGSQKYSYKDHLLAVRTDYSSFGDQETIAKVVAFNYDKGGLVSVVSKDGQETLAYALEWTDLNTEFIKGTDRQILRFYDSAKRLTREIVWYLSNNWSIKYENTELSYDEAGRISKITKDSTYLDQGSHHNVQTFVY